MFGRLLFSCAFISCYFFVPNLNNLDIYETFGIGLFFLPNCDGMNKHMSDTVIIKNSDVFLPFLEILL